MAQIKASSWIGLSFLPIGSLIHQFSSGKDIGNKVIPATVAKLGGQNGGPYSHKGCICINTLLGPVCYNITLLSLNNRFSMQLSTEAVKILACRLYINRHTRASCLT